MPWFNNSTGIWTAVYYGGTANYCAGIKNEVFIDKKDRDILKKLAFNVSILSSRPIEKEKKKLWYEHNDLNIKYPVVFCDPENGWNEIITEEMIECKGELARRWEMTLRKEIFYGEKMKDDKPIENIFEVGYTFVDTEWGIKEKYQGGLNGGSYTWEPAIKGEKDLSGIHYPEVIVDYKTTSETVRLAMEIFRDFLNIRLKAVFGGFPMTRILAKFIGLEQMMFYMYDKPQLIHKIMKIILNGYMNLLDFLEDNNLLTLNNDNSYVGSGGLGYTNDLPGREVEKENLVTSDLWGQTESQETSGISPQMFEEFVFQYQLPIQKRFGLNCYGCCEALDKRWHIVKNVPNLRRVSVSPWADKAKMAENLKDKYIFSAKPNPVYLSDPVMNEDLVRSKIKETLVLTDGCILELVMKDNHTIGRNPLNVINWVKIAKEEVFKKFG